MGGAYFKMVHNFFFKSLIYKLSTYLGELPHVEVVDSIILQHGRTVSHMQGIQQECNSKIAHCCCQYVCLYGWHLSVALCCLIIKTVASGDHMMPHCDHMMLHCDHMMLHCDHMMPHCWRYVNHSISLCNAVRIS